jgi:hypothetical protein
VCSPRPFSPPVTRLSECHSRDIFTVCSYPRSYWYPPSRVRFPLDTLNQQRFYRSLLLHDRSPTVHSTDVGLLASHRPFRTSHPKRNSHHPGCPSRNDNLAHDLPPQRCRSVILRVFYSIWEIVHGHAFVHGLHYRYHHRRCYLGLARLVRRCLRYVAEDRGMDRYVILPPAFPSLCCI